MIGEITRHYQKTGVCVYACKCIHAHGWIVCACVQARVCMSVIHVHACGAQRRTSDVLLLTVNVIEPEISLETNF